MKNQQINKSKNGSIPQPFQQIESAKQTGKLVSELDSDGAFQLLKYISSLTGAPMPDEQLAIQVLRDHVFRFFGDLKSEEIRLAMALNATGQMDDKDGSAKAFGKLSVTFISDVVKRYRNLKREYLRKYQLNTIPDGNPTTVISDYNNLASIMVIRIKYGEYPMFHKYPSVFGYLVKKFQWEPTPEQWFKIEKEERNQRKLDKRHFSVISGMPDGGFVNGCKKRAVWLYLDENYFDTENPSEFLEKCYLTLKHYL